MEINKEFFDKVIMQNFERINALLDIKEYLDGAHKIDSRGLITYKDEEYQYRKIKMFYANSILDFHSSYFKKTNLIGASDKFEGIYKEYYDLDKEIYDSLLTYGEAFEYVFHEDGKYKSKILDVTDCYPIIDDSNNYVGLLEHYTTIDNVTVYVLYLPDKVYKFEQVKDELVLQGEYGSLGLPIFYCWGLKTDKWIGSGLTDRMIPLIDEIESLCSKYDDAIYLRVLNPVDILIGGELDNPVKTDDLLKYIWQIEAGGDYKSTATNLDHQSFDSAFTKIFNALLHTTYTPFVAFTNSSLSNLSEESISMIYSIADRLAEKLSRIMKDGIKKRIGIIQQYTDNKDSIDVSFIFDKPKNKRDILTDINSMWDRGLIDLQSYLELNPYISDVKEVINRIKNNPKFKVEDIIKLIELEIIDKEQGKKLLGLNNSN
jgi:hypothetical protein